MDLTDAQDRCLAERAAAGDDEAFAALVGRHREALVRFVARRTGGRTTIAEDAVQDALVSALHALRGADPPRDVKAWLHTVAWRRAVDLLRREAPPAGAWEDLRTVEGIDVAVADAWELDRMLGHWAGLPRRQRHALAMRVLEGRSLEEIGRELGVSPDAAKSLVARSRRSLAVAVASGEPHAAPPRRRRHLLFLPPALVERLREAATFAMQHEQPASLVTKACAGACAAVLAGGASTAVVAVAPVQPLVKPAAEHAAAAKKRKPRPPAPPRRARPTPTPMPTPAPVRTPAPTPGTAKPESNPQTAAAVTKQERRRTASRRPSPYPAGGETFKPNGEPTATPTPVPTAEPEATPAPTAEPAG